MTDGCALAPCDPASARSRHPKRAGRSLGFFANIASAANAVWLATADEVVR